VSDILSDFRWPPGWVVALNVLPAILGAVRGLIRFAEKIKSRIKIRIRINALLLTHYGSRITPFRPLKTEN
jgi:hypothetical protein